MSDFIVALFPSINDALSQCWRFCRSYFNGSSNNGHKWYRSQILCYCVNTNNLYEFVLEFVNNISDDDYKVSNLSNLLRKSALWVQGIFMTVFIAIITIRSIAAKSLDLVTMKTAKFAVDSLYL